MQPATEAAASTSAMTDEDILGIDAEESPAASSDVGHGGTGPEGGEKAQDAGLKPAAPQDSAAAEAAPGPAAPLRASAPEWLKPLLGDAKVGTEMQQLWEQHQGYREVFPTVAEARAVKELFPGGVEEARQARARSEEVDRIDDAYFSGDPRGQAQLAAYLLETNPRAFQTMLAQAARVLAERDPAAWRALAQQSTEAAGKPAGTEGQAAMPVPPKSGPSAADDSLRAGAAQTELARERAELDRERQEFRAEQYASFQQSANDAVVTQVRQTIEQSVAGVLPATVPDGARTRIAADIFGEINTALQNDRALTRQVAALLRSWQFTDQTKQQVVKLIFTRAKALLPGVAKRVVSDWTSSVLSANRAKLEKQEAAARRVDITGGGATEPRSARALRPRDIDYSRTSDDDILSL